MILKPIEELAGCIATQVSFADAWHYRRATGRIRRERRTDERFGIVKVVHPQLTRTTQLSCTKFPRLQTPLLQVVQIESLYLSIWWPPGSSLCSMVMLDEHHGNESRIICENVSRASDKRAMIWCTLASKS